MPLFMFVSGYVYWATRKPVKYKKFVWIKFKRLMIPYYFISIVVIVIKMITEKRLWVPAPVTYSAFYEMLYLPVAGAFLWFVFTLFIIFLIIPFFNTRKRLSVFLLLSLVLFFVQIPFPKVFCLEKFRMYLLYFSLGCAFFEWTNIRKFIDKTHFLFVLCVFVGLYIIIQNTNIEIYAIKKLAKACIALSGIFFISNLSKFFEQKTIFARKMFLNVSICSYTIYLFHTTFQGFTKAIMLKFPFSSSTNFNNVILFLSTAFIVILAGVIVPIIIHNLVARYSKLLSFLLGAEYNREKK